ncbi:MAG: hypothetical protein FWE69_08345, partial [Clostridiales bacterium]|nr:hypothetical protein [Clostridiales bacterium]
MRTLNKIFPFGRIKIAHASALCIALALALLQPTTAAAATAAQLVTTINGFTGGAGAEGALAANAAGDTVTVTGSKTNITANSTTLELNIDAGVTVVWKATLERSGGTWSPAIRLLGSGAFVVESEGKVKVSASVGDAIGINGANAVTVKEGGTVSATTGNAISAIGANIAVTVSGGTVSSATTTGNVISASGVNSTVTVSGTGKVLVTGAGGNAISAGGIVKVEGDAVVSATGTAISAIGADSAVTVSGGMVSSATTTGNVISAIGANSTVTVSGTGKVLATGGGNAILTGGSVKVEGDAVVCATTGNAIRRNNASSSITVSGGLVFAYGTGIFDLDNVINSSFSFGGPTLDGVIIAWNRRVGFTNYVIGDKTDITVSPSTATAEWDIPHYGAAGISYKKGANAGFIQLPVVVLSDAPMAKDPVPTQKVEEMKIATFVGDDIAVDHKGLPLTITNIVTNPDPAKATASLSSGVVAIVGIAAGTTSINVTVSNGTSTANILAPIQVDALAGISAPEVSVRRKNPQPDDSAQAAFSPTLGQSTTAWFAGRQWVIIGWNGDGVASAPNTATLLLANASANKPEDKAFNTISNHSYAGSNLQSNLLDFFDNNWPEAEKRYVAPRNLDGNSAAYMGAGSGFIDATTFSAAAGNASADQYATGSRLAPGHTLDWYSYHGLRTSESENIGRLKYTGNYHPDRVAGSGVSGQPLWPLSVEEASLLHGTIREYGTSWWLRSPGLETRFAAFVYADGQVTNDGDSVGYVRALRPAFNINLSSVLFTSAASGAGGKPAGMGLAELTSAPAGPVKFTMQSDSQSLVVVTTTAQSTQSGPTLKFGYRDATWSATGQYVSCVLEQGGA